MTRWNPLNRPVTRPYHGLTDAYGNLDLPKIPKPLRAAVAVTRALSVGESLGAYALEAGDPFNVLHKIDPFGIIPEQKDDRPFKERLKSTGYLIRDTLGLAPGGIGFSIASATGLTEKLPEPIQQLMPFDKETSGLRAAFGYGLRRVPKLPGEEVMDVTTGTPEQQFGKQTAKHYYDWQDAPGDTFQKTVAGLLLDPTTYIPGVNAMKGVKLGAQAGVKAAGKAGAELAAEAIAKRAARELGEAAAEKTAANIAREAVAKAAAQEAQAALPAIPRAALGAGRFIGRGALELATGVGPKAAVPFAIGMGAGTRLAEEIPTDNPYAQLAASLGLGMLGGSAGIRAVGEGGTPVSRITAEPPKPPQRGTELRTPEPGPFAITISDEVVEGLQLKDKEIAIIRYAEDDTTLWRNLKDLYKREAGLDDEAAGKLASARASAIERIRDYIDAVRAREELEPEAERIRSARPQTAARPQEEEGPVYGPPAPPPLHGPPAPLPQYQRGELPHYDDEEVEITNARNAARNILEAPEADHTQAEVERAAWILRETEEAELEIDEGAGTHYLNLYHVNKDSVDERVESAARSLVGDAFDLGGPTITRAGQIRFERAVGQVVRALNGLSKVQEARQGISDENFYIPWRRIRIDETGNVFFDGKPLDDLAYRFEGETAREEPEEPTGEIFSALVKQTGEAEASDERFMLPPVENRTADGGKAVQAKLYPTFVRAEKVPADEPKPKYATTAAGEYTLPRVRDDGRTELWTEHDGRPLAEFAELSEEEAIEQAKNLVRAIQARVSEADGPRVVYLSIASGEKPPTASEFDELVQASHWLAYALEAAAKELGIETLPVRVAPFIDTKKLPKRSDYIDPTPVHFTDEDVKARNPAGVIYEVQVGNTTKKVSRIAAEPEAKLKKSAEQIVDGALAYQRQTGEEKPLIVLVVERGTDRPPTPLQQRRAVEKALRLQAAIDTALAKRMKEARAKARETGAPMPPAPPRIRVLPFVHPSDEAIQQIKAKIAARRPRTATPDEVPKADRAVAGTKRDETEFSDLLGEEFEPEERAQLIDAASREAAKVDSRQAEARTRYLSEPVKTASSDETGDDIQFDISKEAAEEQAQPDEIATRERKAVQDRKPQSQPMERNVVRLKRRKITYSADATDETRPEDIRFMSVGEVLGRLRAEIEAGAKEGEAQPGLVTLSRAVAERFNKARYEVADTNESLQKAAEALSRSDGDTRVLWITKGEAQPDRPEIGSDDELALMKAEELADHLEARDAYDEELVQGFGKIDTETSTRIEQAKEQGLPPDQLEAKIKRIEAQAVEAKKKFLREQRDEYFTRLAARRLEAGIIEFERRTRSGTETPPADRFGARRNATHLVAIGQETTQPYPGEALAEPGVAYADAGTPGLRFNPETGRWDPLAQQSVEGAQPEVTVLRPLNIRPRQASRMRISVVMAPSAYYVRDGDTVRAFRPAYITIWWRNKDGHFEEIHTLYTVHGSTAARIAANLASLVSAVNTLFDLEAFGSFRTRPVRAAIDPETAIGIAMTMARMGGDTTPSAAAKTFWLSIQASLLDPSPRRARKALVELSTLLESTVRNLGVAVTSKDKAQTIPIKSLVQRRQKVRDRIVERFFGRAPPEKKSAGSEQPRTKAAPEPLPAVTRRADDEIPGSALRQELESEYPGGTTLGDLIANGHRRAETALLTGFRPGDKIVYTSRGEEIGEFEVVAVREIPPDIESNPEARAEWEKLEGLSWEAARQQNPFIYRPGSKQVIFKRPGEPDPEFRDWTKPRKAQTPEEKLARAETAAGAEKPPKPTPEQKLVKRKEQQPEQAAAAAATPTAAEPPASRPAKTLPMNYEMPKGSLREDLAAEYPGGTSTAQLILDGKRRATTRRYADLKPGERVTFTRRGEAVEGEYEVVAVRQIPKDADQNEEFQAEWEQLEGWSWQYARARFYDQVRPGSYQVIFKRPGEPDPEFRDWSGGQKQPTPHLEAESKPEADFGRHGTVDAGKEELTPETVETAAYHRTPIAEPIESTKPEISDETRQTLEEFGYWETGDGTWVLPTEHGMEVWPWERIRVLRQAREQDRRPVLVSVDEAEGEKIINLSDYSGTSPDPEIRSITNTIHPFHARIKAKGNPYGRWTAGLREQKGAENVVGSFEGSIQDYVVVFTREGVSGTDVRTRDPETGKEKLVRKFLAGSHVPRGSGEGKSAASNIVGTAEGARMRFDPSSKSPLPEDIQLARMYALFFSQRPEVWHRLKNALDNGAYITQGRRFNAEGKEVMQTPEFMNRSAATAIGYLYESGFSPDSRFDLAHNEAPTMADIVAYTRGQKSLDEIAPEGQALEIEREPKMVCLYSKVRLEE